jgi:urease accessory protein UreF
MAKTVKSMSAAAPRLRGDAQSLVRQLAVPAEGWSLAAANGGMPGTVRDVPTLRGFLTWYRTEILVPTELPAISRAFHHAQRHEVRELLELDNALAREPRLAHFAKASLAVGRSQLWRLLPLRDQRLVRRYWHALECGHAHGWHVLIYGVVLSVFSLPLRPGLLNYGRQALRGFVESAARSCQLAEGDCARLLEDEWTLLPAAAERALGVGTAPPVLC